MTSQQLEKASLVVPQDGDFEGPDTIANLKDSGTSRRVHSGPRLVSFCHPGFNFRFFFLYVIISL
jgi:hypothetical protein